jgi:putative transport protein
VPIPVGLNTKLQRLDVLFVGGVKSAVDHAAALLGKVARPSTVTDLLMWSIGMILGFLIGLLGFPVQGSMVTLGAGAGLLVSGVIVSSIASRVRFIGYTPNAARNIIEDLGLVLFISMVGVNSGAALISQLTGAITLKILVAGFICTTIPPILVWAIGYHLMNINAAVLMGGVAGARTHSGPAREAAKEIESSVPWVGFPIGYAVAGVLLTVFGYLSMALAK